MDELPTKTDWPECPKHPDLGITCDNSRPDHTLCTAATPHPKGYSATWVRTWWRDGSKISRARNLQGSP